MPARKKITKRAKIELTEGQIAWLNSEPYQNTISHFCAYFNAGLLKYQTSKELWDAYKRDILEKWIADNPCTRPERWWQFDAPEKRLSFETEAAYLQRHGLLIPAEKKLLAVK